VRAGPDHAVGVHGHVAGQFGDRPGRPRPPLRAKAESPGVASDLLGILDGALDKDLAAPIEGTLGTEGLS
jgi:hypothetical protein